MTILDNWKKITIAVFVLILVLGISFALYKTVTRKTQPKVPTRPTAEQIKIINGKTVPLGQNAKDLKQQIIAAPIRIDRGDKYLVQSREFTIVYVPSPDQFYVQINNNPAQENKALAQKWFTDKGFSSQDLCGLGIHFQLAVPGATLQEIQNFNTAPAGCPTLN